MIRFIIRACLVFGLFKYAVAEAKRLDLEVQVNFGLGCSLGGNSVYGAASRARSACFFAEDARK